MSDANEEQQTNPPDSAATNLGGLDPGQLFARGLNSVKMSAGSGAQWTPPTVAEVAHLFPNYEVLAMIGHGGMGAVYKAKQVALDRMVAIKLLPLEISIDKEFADRFVREARAMAKLNHPNIIAVYDFGKTSEGHLFFVMEFVEGANLHQIIHSVGLDPEQALSLATQICAALAYAHGKGVVHRDIKPANVMVDTESHVKVADFGLARLTDPNAEQWGHTMTGTVLGTPDYMAPEQKRGMNVDHRADIYSLGVMLYEMLCREIPQGVFAPPSQRTGCDPRIDEIVIRAMQQQPELRYQTTTEMKGAVDTVRVPLPRPDPIHLPAPEAASQAASQPAKKNRAQVWIASAVVIAALAGAAFFNSKHRAKDAGSVAKTASDNAPEPGAIRLWDSQEKVPNEPGRRWEQDSVRLDAQALISYVNLRDVSFRARVCRNSDAEGWQISIRSHPSTTGGKTGSNYVFGESEGPQWLILSATKDGQRTKLATWPMPPSTGSDDWLALELRAVGDEITAYANGRILGTVHDASVTEAGGVQIYAKTAGYFRNIVYVPLDKPGGAASASSPQPAPGIDASAALALPTTGWQPLDPGWEHARAKKGFTVLSDGWARVENQWVGGNKTPQDAGIRCRVRWSSDAMVSMSLRHAGQTREDYSACNGVVDQRAMKVELFRRVFADGKPSPDDKLLAEAPLPAKLAAGEECEFALAALGDELTLYFNGQPVVTARDSYCHGEEVTFGTTKAMEIKEVDWAPFGKPGADTPAPACPQPPKWTDATTTLRNHYLASGVLEAEGEWLKGASRVHGFDLAPGLQSRNPIVRVRFSDCLDVQLRRTTNANDSSSYGGIIRRDRVGINLNAKSTLRLVETHSSNRLEGEHEAVFAAQGGTLTLWLDGKQVATAHDDALASGGIAVVMTKDDPIGDSRIKKVEYGELPDAAPVSRSPTLPISPSFTPAAATKDAPFVNSLGMKFVPVPITGGPTDGQRVLFSVWDTRVQDYAAFVKEEWRERPKPDFEQGPTHPAIYVSWEDAQAFCLWLTVHERRANRIGTNYVFRLPTDHEWSCAAGIGEREDAMMTPSAKNRKISDTFWWGTQWPPPKGSGNYAGEEMQPALAGGKYANIKGVIAGYNDAYVNTSPVGTYAPNRFGLYDIGGNVWQWCEDWFDESQKGRVLRGASWHENDRSDLLASSRLYFAPGYRYYVHGFRCVLAPVAAPTAR